MCSKLERSIRELCTRAGVTLLSLDETCRHPKGRVRLPDGRERQATFSKTPSDHRQQQNQVSMLRRWARETTQSNNHIEENPQ